MGGDGYTFTMLWSCKTISLISQTVCKNNHPCVKMRRKERYKRIIASPNQRVIKYLYTLKSAAVTYNLFKRHFHVLLDEQYFTRETRNKKERLVKLHFIFQNDNFSLSFSYIFLHGTHSCFIHLDYTCEYYFCRFIFHYHGLVNLLIENCLSEVLQCLLRLENISFKRNQEFSGGKK